MVDDIKFNASHIMNNNKSQQQNDNSDKFKNDLLAYFNVQNPQIEKKYKNTSEYAAELNKWLNQCYTLQCFYASLPFFMLSTLQNQQRYISNNTRETNNFLTQSFIRDQNANIQGFVANSGRDFLIPPLWKRFASEIVDFVLLLLIQLLVVVLVVDYFELVNLEKIYDLQVLHDDRANYRLYLQVTSEILFLEVLHRAVVCLFEALCLSQGVRSPGGATPGKSLFRLRVVSCRAVIASPNNPALVRVYPAQNIGLGWALLRAFIKNFSMAFFFPAIFTMFFFQHNRTAYDIICSTIVVEDPA